MVGQHTCHVGQQVRAVQRLDLNLDHEQALGAGPFHRNHTLGLVLLQVKHVLAVGAVHGDALIACDEADDVVAGHRRAAACELHPHVVHALDGDADRVRMLLATFHLTQRQHLLLDLLVDFGGAGVLDETGDHVLRGDLAVADRRIHGVGVREVELFGHTDQRLRSQQRGNRQVALAHRARQLVFAFLNRLGAAFLAEPLADLVACLRAFHEAQPVA